MTEIGIIQVRRAWILLAVTGLIGLSGCEHKPNRPAAKAVADEPKENGPLFEGLGGFGRPVTTSSREAQHYFDQGLCFLYAFNHDEAIRAFQQAAQIDPDCAMAWWGIAIANGPHINNPV